MSDRQLVFERERKRERKKKERKKERKRERGEGLRRERYAVAFAQGMPLLALFVHY